MTIEFRSLVGPENIDATDEGVIFGLAIPYNRATNIGDPKSGGFEERIAPGSATKSLREADIVALYNHDSSRPLGRTSAGNLTLVNTTRGVEPELKPSDVSYARDLATLVKDKIIRGWSFGFEVIKDEWTDDDGNTADQWTGTKRTIREMKLIEVSPVTFPAYDTTEISSRSAILDAREERAKAAAEAPEGETEERGGNAPGDGKKPYGDVKYADPGYQSDKKKRYPVDTRKHVKAALAYIAKKKNAAAYSADQLAKIKAHIRSAAKKFGIDVNEQNELELAVEWRCYLKDYDPALVIDDTTEERDDGDFEDRKLKSGVAKRIAQIDVILGEALDALRKCGLDKLPDGAQRAASLISSAAEHSSHIMHAEDLTAVDGVGSRDEKTSADQEQRETQPKPDGESTSAETPLNDALRLASMQAVSRAVELGLLSVFFKQKKGHPAWLTR
jgi:HK97 family phage prohead protease